jgi:adenylate cyclase
MGASATTAGRLHGRDATASRSGLADAVTRRLTLVLLGAHAVGILDVALLLFYVLPSPVARSVVDDATPANLIAIAVVVPLAAGIGVLAGRRLSATRMAWAREDRDPTAEERARLLRIPARTFKLDAAMWVVAAGGFFAVNAPFSVALAAQVTWTILLGGITTCAVAHLLMERLLRPLSDLALSFGPPARPAWPGVQGRLVLAWLLATGSPLLGVITLGVVGAASRVTAEELARSAAVLGALAFAIGLGTTVIVARSVASPLTAVRRALGRVQAGDLGAEVAVDDGSEVGLLQSGFNSMVAGLRERARPQELFARHVGEDVARAALDGDPRVGGGEVQEVAVLFVDMVGSTTLAAEAPPTEVVARLNDFFAVIVDVVDGHGGWVNKFEGDAALCVFGAPVAQADAAGCALRAGRALHGRLRRELPAADAGIGLSAGPAVAGWVGAVERFEYTVIGDAVNVAARLCELAKQRPERVLASGAILERAVQDEAARWAVGDEVTLRGRTAATAVAVPLRH